MQHIFLGLLRCAIGRRRRLALARQRRLVANRFEHLFDRRGRSRGGAEREILRRVAEQRAQLHSLTIANQAVTGLDYEPACRAVLTERPDLLGIASMQAQQPASGPQPTPLSAGQRRAELDRIAQQRVEAEGLSYYDAVMAVASERPELAQAPTPIVPEGSARFKELSAKGKLNQLALARQKKDGCPYEVALAAIAKEHPALYHTAYPTDRSSLEKRVYQRGAVNPRGAAAEELNRQAQAKLQAEGGDYEAACRAVLAQNPALAAAYTGRAQ